MVQPVTLDHVLLLLNHVDLPADILIALWTVLNLDVHQHFLLLLRAVIRELNNRLLLMLFILSSKVLLHDHLLASIYVDVPRPL